MNPNNDSDIDSGIGGGSSLLGASSGVGMVGLGFDVCDHQRIVLAWQRFGGRFLSRIYTNDEICHALRPLPVGQDPAAIDPLALSSPRCALIGGRLARMFAAKEAASKALKTGIAQGVSWRMLEVGHESGGAPVLLLHSVARDTMRRLLHGQPGGIHLTLSSEGGSAYALAVIATAAGPYG